VRDTLLVPDDLWTVALAGVAAGLGVAMPLGAVAALIVREGLVRGFRTAAAAAVGVGAVDTAYCAVAMAAGAAVAPAVQAYRGVFLVVSGLLVTAVGVRQLVLGRRAAAPVVDGATTERGSGTSPVAVFLRFVGLTAVNPLTLVYFAALAGAVTANTASWRGPAVFVAAVGAASLAWQLVLAAGSSLLGRSVGLAMSRRVGLVASLLVVVLGLSILVGGVAQLRGGP